MQTGYILLVHIIALNHPKFLRNYQVLSVKIIQTALPPRNSENHFHIDDSIHYSLIINPFKCIQIYNSITNLNHLICFIHLHQTSQILLSLNYFIIIINILLMKLL